MPVTRYRDLGDTVLTQECPKALNERIHHRRLGTARTQLRPIGLLLGREPLRWSISNHIACRGDLGRVTSGLRGGGDWHAGEAFRGQVRGSCSRFRARYTLDNPPR